MGLRLSSPSRRSAALLLGIACALPLGGCYTYHAYQVGGPGDREAQNQPGTEWEGVTRHALLWGLVRQDVPIGNCRLGDGTRLNIEEFKVETNFLYALASVVTLGIWVPVEVSWRCAKPKGPTGTLDREE